MATIRCRGRVGLCHRDHADRQTEIPETDAPPDIDPIRQQILNRDHPKITPPDKDPTRKRTTLVIDLPDIDPQPEIPWTEILLRPSRERPRKGHGSMPRNLGRNMEVASQTGIDIIRDSPCERNDTRV